MSIDILTVPFMPDQELFHVDEVKRFMPGKQVKSIRPEFFQMNGKAYWTIFIDYETVLCEPEIRERPGLSEPQRLLFSRLRQWRKEKADREGVPVYILTTNSELEQLVVKAPTTLESLRSIKGFGRKKVERHGREIIEIIKAFHEKKPMHGPAAPKDTP